MALHPVDIHVGKRLRMRRTIMGLSQDSLATSVGVTCQQVQKYEAGINRMSPSRLYEFSKILGEPINFFFDEYEGDKNDSKHRSSQLAQGLAENSGAEFEYESMTSRETLLMVRAYYRISNPNVRKSVFELIKSLADDDLEDNKAK